LLLPFAQPANTPTRHYTVQMRVKAQVLPPGMQHGYHAHLYTLLPAKLMDGLPCGTEQSIIHLFGLVQSKGVQLTGQREHYMIVGAGQQFLLPLLYPLFPLVPLAFRAMPVTAAIVADMYYAALCTCVHMTAQCRCTALLQGA
jgi:hypothetical protein